MIDRPIDQAAAEVLAEFELQRPRARELDRLADPEIAVCTGGIKRIAAVFVVDQHAEARASGRDLRRCLDRQHLEGRNAREKRLVSRGHVFELAAMVDRKRHQKRNVATTGGCPVNVVDRLVLAQRPLLAAVFEEEL
ncbi:hypothetical protein D9M70_444490 [compost metagenome]